MKLKVLLISHKFYDYHNVIKDGIERLGYDCDGYCFANGFLYRLFLHIPYCEKISKKIRENHFRRHIPKYANPYDFVIVVRGSALSVKNHELLRQLNPSSKFSLYIWDDIAYDVEELAIRHFYDKVFSYNPQECKKYGMIFRPMFYDNSIDNGGLNKDIDIFYIGTSRSNRADFMDRIVENTKSYGLKYKIIIRSNLYRFLIDRKKVHHWRYSNFRNVSYYEMFTYLKRSVCSVELCPQGQEALTTRAFEALYTKTKIITTNRSISQYDFYNPSNVLIVDEENPVIPVEWIQEPFCEIEKSVLDKYSLDVFCRELLSF